ncbi:MAG: GHKL domain-containing protein [Pseudomonadales bacterium]|nr:GHKL domain-containing protein [Pseudomonadales bacterium]
MPSLLMPSLRGRLTLAACLILLSFLGFTGYVLDRAFQHSVENALLERLKTHIYALLTAAEDENGNLIMPTLLQDPEFNRIDSGRYGIIINHNGKEIWRSPSAISLSLPKQTPTTAGAYHLTKTRIGKDNLYRISYGVIWENQNGSESHYTFQVLQNTLPTDAEISGFRQTLWRWLGGLGLLLLAIQGAILRWGLAPLPRLAEDLHRIEQGKQDQLSGNYPSELQPVATNLNLLIANERRQRQRYRNTLADLAHSLKTPLAILRGIVSAQPATLNNESFTIIDEQINRMDQLVSYQLQRAVSPETSLSSKPIELMPLALKLIRSLEKVYQDKGVSLQVEIDTPCRFIGDERDLMEVLGNLLDNAFKFCRHRVKLSAKHLTTPTGNNRLFINIENDGSPIPTAEQARILQRGARADTSQPGQGIGLAVALEIITSYQGTLAIDQSTLGGALFRVEFPHQPG